MKKWIWILAIATVGFAIYYDVSRGTLPMMDVSSEVTDDLQVEETNGSLAYDRTVDIEIEPGQSLLTVVEELHETGTPVAIETIKEDFIHLNEGQPPEQLEHGQVYTFPLYES
ncbi:hypothetical protein HNR44_000811 [Geomicrobium halophilum]|uniref:LysM domain-containing protein n=1 Tax=Geomicrobium halophilum TaxID=549000 RepID=A0A841PXK7_9BACL|nr:hypothetical protein [Geomicrobium halophilum]MBB6448862.1 hypothetical protein [Geomicrobium halophilum]